MDYSIHFAFELYIIEIKQMCQWYLKADVYVISKSVYIVHRLWEPHFLKQVC